jgi:serine protease Do
VAQAGVSRRRALAVAAAALAAGQLTSHVWAQGLPATVASVRGSVVPVGTFSATDSPRFGFSGTGFVVGDGTLVATNYHVLPHAAGLPGGPMMAVLSPRGLEAGSVRMARVVATDRNRDLALLKIEGAPLPALVLDETNSAREGQAIALMGFPIGGVLGFSPVTHRGIVASITSAALPAPTAQQLDPRAVARLREGNFEVLQLDATAYPGNSGGPVFDADTGRVLGLVNLVLVKGSRESALTNPTGISYAIPVKYLVELMKAR